jgi:predicted PurR-regulated permease PerM
LKFRKEKTEEALVKETTREVADEVAKEVAKEAAVVATEVAVLETWPQKRVIIRVIIIFLLFAAMLWVLYRLKGVLLLVVLAVFFAYLIAPLVELVRRPFHARGRERTIPRGAAIGIVYLVLFSALFLALWILLPRLSKQIKAFSDASTQFQTTAAGRVKLINDFCRRNEIPENACDAINGAMMRGVEGAKNYIATDLPNLIVGIISYIPWLILIPILSFFLLNDADDFRRSALQMLPRGRWRWRGDEFFQDVNSTLAAYIRAQLTACLLIGTICTLGFIALGVPFPLVIGVIAGFLEFIPLVGPLVVAIIAVLVTSFSPDTSSYSGLWVLLFLGTLRIVHDYSIYPRLVGQGVHLHPLAVILAILAGNELAGIAGIFLSIPLIAVATVSYRHWLEHRGSEGLVAEILQPAEGTDTPPEPGDELAPYYEDEVPDEPVRHHPRDGHSHPDAETTPDEMARARPDLTTGELKMPKT